MRLVSCAFLALALCALSVPPTAAQEAKTPTPEKKDVPLVKVYQAGKDAVIVLPKGLEYMTEKSKYLGTEPTIVVEKIDGGSQKLILRERSAVVSSVGGSKVTIKVGGTPVTPKVFIGIPEGATVDDQTKKKEEPAPKK
jgi:hypothetical protein